MILRCIWSSICRSLGHNLHGTLTTAWRPNLARSHRTSLTVSDNKDYSSYIAELIRTTNAGHSYHFLGTPERTSLRLSITPERGSRSRVFGTSIIRLSDAPGSSPFKNSAEFHVQCSDFFLRAYAADLGCHEPCVVDADGETEFLITVASSRAPDHRHQA